MTNDPVKRSGGPTLRTYAMAAAAAALAGFIAIYVQLPGPGNDGTDTAETPPATATTSTGGGPQPADETLAGLNRGTMTTFVFHREPAALPAFTLTDRAGRKLTGRDLQGRVILLNIWATWCAPCRKEMPALDSLQARLGGKDFEVVAVNTDRGGPAKAEKFFADTGVRALGLYVEDEASVSKGLKVFGMPTTLLIDREGREIGRLVGPAEWDSDDARALIEAAISRRS